MEKEYQQELFSYLSKELGVSPLKGQMNDIECIVLRDNKIIDDFAIDFAVWLDELSNAPLDSLDYHYFLTKDKKQLLKIYKEIKR